MQARSLLLAPLLLGSACVVPRLDVRPAVSRVGISGDFGASDELAGGTVSGTSSLSALGLGGEDSVFEPRVDLSWIGPHVMVSTLSSSFSGRGRTEAEIDLDDQTIGVDVEVDSELDLDVHRLGFTWDVVPTKLVEAGVGVGVTVIGLDLSIQEVGGSNTRIESDETFPIPTLCGRVGVHVGPFEAGLDLGWLRVSSSDTDVELFDYELGVSYDVLGGGQHLAVRLTAGYRGLDIDAEYEDDESDADVDFLLDGFLYGITVSF